MRRATLKATIATKIGRSSRLVFVRSDFEALGGYDQVGRALRQLVSEGKLIKIGYGLYAKARTNRLTGKPMLAADGGFNQVAQAALKRLGIEWSPSDAANAYQQGSTQIPANAQVIVSERFSRIIATDKCRLQVMRV